MNVNVDPVEEVLIWPDVPVALSMVIEKIESCSSKLVTPLETITALLPEGFVGKASMPLATIGGIVNFNATISPSETNFIEPVYTTSSVNCPGGVLGSVFVVTVICEVSVTPGEITLTSVPVMVVVIGTAGDGCA